MKQKYKISPISVNSKITVSIKVDDAETCLFSFRTGYDTPVLVEATGNSETMGKEDSRVASFHMDFKAIKVK